MATLDNVSADDLRQLLTAVDDAAATQRLMAAITFKEIEGLTQAEAAALYGFSPSWASKWFNCLERLNDAPVEEVLYNQPRSGRPPKLTDEQHRQFVDALHEPPENVGLDARAWTVPLAERYLEREFDVEYCERHVRRLMTQAGLS